MEVSFRDYTKSFSLGYGTDKVVAVTRRFFVPDYFTDLSMLDANNKRWTSSQFSNEVAYYSNPVSGIMSGSPLYREWTVSPITIYEF